MKVLLNLVESWSQLEEELNTYRYHIDMMEGTGGPRYNLTLQMMDGVLALAHSFTKALTKINMYKTT